MAGLVELLSDVRIATYRREWAEQAGTRPADVSDDAVSALYMWQVALSAAWYEALSYGEAVLRHTMDVALRSWNAAQVGSTDWLEQPAPALSKIVGRTAADSRSRAETAARRRDPGHPRRQAAVTLDDRISQLSFGDLAFLLPVNAPKNRAQFSTGMNARENLWLHALSQAFPNSAPGGIPGWEARIPRGVPPQVVTGYAVGGAIDQLRRLRNRISHQEQAFRVQHDARLKDLIGLLASLSADAATEFCEIEQVHRLLKLRPRP